MAVNTVEDGWAVRLVDMMAGLHQLRVEGVTREMYIWGNVQVKSSHQSRNRCCTSCMVVRADMQHVAQLRFYVLQTATPHSMVKYGD